MSDAPSSFRVVAAEAGRADVFLADKLPGRGRRALARAFDEGQVRVNGKKARKGDRVVAGDLIEVLEDIPDAVGLRPVAEPGLAYEELFADECMIALNKPAGMASHPLRARELGTAANALVAHHPECATAGADPREGGLAQRLDAGTSGVLVAARDRATWELLRRAFHDRRVIKTYLALVVGEVRKDGGVDAPIAHEPHGGGVRVCEDPDDADRHGALEARTRWTTVKVFAGFTLLRCTAETGRMHQVRAHLAHAGTPVVGDERYGIAVAGQPVLAGHFLHAESLELDHPLTGERMTIKAALPADRAAALATLESP